MTEAAMKECCVKIVEKINEADVENKDAYLYAAKVLKIYAENLLILPISALLSYHIKKDDGVNYNSYLKCLGENLINDFITKGLGYEYKGSDWILPDKPNTEQRNAAIEAINQLNQVLAVGKEKIKIVEKEKNETVGKKEARKIDTEHNNGDNGNDSGDENQKDVDDKKEDTQGETGGEEEEHEDDNGGKPKENESSDMTNSSYNKSYSNNTPTTDSGPSYNFDNFSSMQTDSAPRQEEENPKPTNLMNDEQPDSVDKIESAQVENKMCSKCEVPINKDGLCKECGRCFDCEDGGRSCAFCLRDFENKKWQCHECFKRLNFDEDCGDCLTCEQCAWAKKLEKASCLKCGYDFKNV